MSSIANAFSNDHPAIEIRMNSSVWANRLALDETDIELRLGFGQWPGYKAELLFSETLIPLCAHQTLKSLPADVSADILAAQQLIHIVGLEDQWGDFFHQHKTQYSSRDQKGRFFTDSSMAAAILASRGSFLPSCRTICHAFY